MATVQAEDAILVNSRVKNLYSGAQDGEYVDIGNKGTITWAISDATSGSQTLLFRYALDARSSQTLQLEVNGQIVENALSFSTTGSFSSWQTISVTVNLSAGENTVRLISPRNSSILIDSLTYASAQAAPVGNDDSYSVAEDTVLNVGATGVLTNDTDSNGDALSAVLVSTVSHGNLTLNANGSFSYTPSANYFGPDSFTYRASDGSGFSNVVTVNLTVTPVNDVPVGQTDSYTVAEDNQLNIAAAGVLANDTDTEGNVLSAVLASTVSHGTLSLNANGSFTYTPSANYSGPDSFTYRASDGTSTGNLVTVNLTVTPVNDAPVGQTDNYTTSANTPLTVGSPGILANDSDVEGTALTAVLVDTVSHGSLSFNANGSFTYTPDSNYSGADSFTYRASDGSATSNLVTVNLMVDPPSSPTSTTLQAEAGALVGAVVATNHAGAQGGAFVDYINASGDSITWTFNAAQAGTYPVHLRYALAGTSSRPMALEINGVIVNNAVPFTATGSLETWSDVTLNVALLGGNNTIRLVANGSSGPNVDSITIDAPIVIPPTNDVTLQAESGILVGAVVANNYVGAQGNAFVDYINATGDSITWNFSAAQAGIVPIDLRYALAGTSSRPMALEINGVIVNNAVPFAATGSFETWSSVSLNVALQSGNNVIRLIANGSSGPNVDSLTIHTSGTPTPPPTPARPDLVLPAETGLLVGSTVEANAAGAQGGAYVDYVDNSGSSVTWTFDSDEAGAFPIAFRYALAGTGSRAMSLQVNGVTVNSSLAFAGSGSNTTWATVNANVNLIAGSNTISLVATGQNGPNLDTLTIIGLEQDGPQFREFMDSTSVLTEGETGVPLDSAFSIGIIIDTAGQELNSATVNASTVRLINTFNDEFVPLSINTTGGADSISVTPMASLQPNVQHVLLISGVEGLNGEQYPSISRSFTTGTTSLEAPPPGITFTRQVVSTGDGIGSLVFSEDYSTLYASTLTGEVIRWDVAANGTLSNRQVFTVEAGRSLIGLALDPTNPNRIWVSNNEGYPADSSAPFGSKITYIDITDTTNFTGTVHDYVVGLPRSAHDHLTNSLVFGPDGFLYFTLGGNTAMGATDAAWGFREETELTASLLRLDTTRSITSGPIDVNTNTGYDPDATNAPLTVYADGLRNSYDLLFHSNGSIYVANNGSAAGGNTPDDPSTSQNEALFGAPAESDYLFKIEEGGYYGHANPAQGHYISYGGNPTAGIDPAQIIDYAVGTMPDPDWAGFAHDFGISRSPNGTDEYKGGFGGALDGMILVAEFSFGDRIVALQLDSAGNVIDEFVLATGFDNPLDLVVHEPSGRIYVANYRSELSFSDDQIVMMTPDNAAFAAAGGELIL